MPELPEVEVTRRCLAGELAGARVHRIELGRPLRWPLGCDPALLEGTVAGEMSRRGKYLWLPLRREASARAANGAPRGGAAGGLLIHLGMSGALSFGALPAPPGPHDHFRLHTDRGGLWLTDPRRFGAVVWSATPEQDPARKLLSGLGPEPFDAGLDARGFHAALARKRTPVKAALLAGDLVVGAGNIYACEALWRARIDPRTPCHRIGLVRAERLLAAVRDVLARAIEAGGSTLRDFNANGVEGHYQTQARVYGRGGEPCPTCARPVRRIVQGQRATYFCAHCQR